MSDDLASGASMSGMAQHTWARRCRQRAAIGLAMLALIALAGCASAPPAPMSSAALFDDAAFAPASEPIDARSVFALSPEMQRYLEERIKPRAFRVGSRAALIEALYERGELKLTYDTEQTRTAAQAFDARSGNCLSLVIMTAAFAKQMHLQVQYQSVLVDDTWSRSGGLMFANGHVNLVLGLRPLDTQFGSHDADLLVVDFLPTEEARRARARSISEDTVLAMFMNNRAAEALAQGRLDDAYWWARTAIAQTPTFMAAYNTLGVIYRRHGNAAQALRVLDYAHAVEPANTLVMSNLIQVLGDLGQTARAQNLAATLARIEPEPPFHYFDLGLAAMRAGDFFAAREYFAKEVARAAYYHEFHFWLALADYRLGHLSQARQHLSVAMENSTTRAEHDLYAAKLDWLRAHTVQ